MSGIKAHTAVVALLFACLLGACGPGNTLSVQNNSADFRLRAVESSLEKAQEELKAVDRRQAQNDARLADLQKRLGELLATLKAQGVKTPAASASQGSALGVGFANPGATAVPPTAQTAQASLTSPSLPAAGEAGRDGPPSDAISNSEGALLPGERPAPSPSPAARPTPAVAPAGAPDVRGRHGLGRVGPAEPLSSPTPEAAIAADRAEAGPKPPVPAAASKTPPAAAEEQPAKAAEEPAVKPAPPVAGNAENASPTEKAEYNKALQLAINGNTAGAKAAFDQFLAAHPQSPLTPNALYWVGEGAFAGGDYQTAISDFEKVAKGWPGHHKAADSLYKMAMAQEKAGDAAAARATLERYLKDYPGAELAGIVRQKLQSLPK